ncbi:DUF5605 domain-containing protein [Parablautia muri]|uniref:DUF5605 domain-containing protein n=1 Tax=Parablautia muri TaxID=2320879 RepID=UPI0038CD6BD6
MAWKHGGQSDDADYKVEVIDTWNMTVTSLGAMRGFHQVKMPGKQYMALGFVK